ncbi:MAG: NAD(P)/FAD-dependent oxidoreductase [Eubacteriales bacterium]
MKKLFSSGKIGSLEIRNRVVMPAMETGLNSISGEVTDRIVAYYEERAAGGCGLIITEITRVAGGAGTGHPVQLNATAPGMIPGLERLANAVHRHGGKIFCQLHHPGREGREMFGGEQIVGPSAIKSLANEEVPRELTTEEVGDIVGKFVMAAKMCEMAGIDGVELHGAHGYLIQQFMCEYSNQRTDKYGGDFLKRMQFPTEIIRSIRMACGENFPVTIRINGDDFFEGGMTLDESVEIAKHLEKVGFDALNVSAGGYAAPNESTEPISYDQGWKRHLGKAIKEAVSIPVIACDVIRKPDFAEKLLVEDNLDFVALGRAQLADPEWCNKAREGKAEEIRPCISCLYCAEQLGSARTIKCAVNPRCSFELVYDKMQKDGKGQRAVVVGGGPAGMQAAISLANRGFKPILFEKSNKLGGYALVASIPPHKDKLCWLVDSMALEMKKLNVDVRMNTEVSAEEVMKLSPAVVFVATGGKPIKPPFPGVNASHVYMVDDVLTDDFNVTGKEFVVVGSGLTGLEVAEFLATKGNHVTVIEREYNIAPGSGSGIGTDQSPNVVDVLKHLKELNVEVKVSTELSEIKEDGTIIVNGNEGEVAMPAEAVVLSLGVRGDSQLIRSFKAQFENLYILGDAQKQGRIADAIRMAYESVYYLKSDVNGSVTFWTKFFPNKLMKPRFPEAEDSRTSTVSEPAEKQPRFSKDTKLGALMANPQAREILIKHFTEALIEHPMIGFAKKMPLSKIAEMSDEIPEEVLIACDEDLRKL